MANRVVLGAFDGTYVLRVSRPGFNVLSTGLTPKQLAFDSRWNEAGNVFMEGSFTLPQGVTVSHSVSFGITLPRPPLVVCRLLGVQSGDYMTVNGQDGQAGSNQSTYVDITTTGFTFQRGWLPVLGAGNNWGVGSRIVHYTVYRNRY